MADLEAKIVRLERKLSPSSAIGQGVSTQYGAVSIRPTQTGSAAELTASWDDTIGYSWKLLAPANAAPVMISPVIQRAGSYAMSFVGDTSLRAGTKGWLDIDPQAKWHVFTHATQDDGSSCSGCGWVAGLDTSCCLILSVDSASGRCATTDIYQRLLLTYNSGTGKWESSAEFDCTGADSLGCIDPSENILRLKVAWTDGSCAALVSCPNCAGLDDLNFNFPLQGIMVTLTGLPAGSPVSPSFPLYRGSSAAPPNCWWYTQGSYVTYWPDGERYRWSLACLQFDPFYPTPTLQFGYWTPWVAWYGGFVGPTLVSCSSGGVPFSAVYTVPEWTLGGSFSGGLVTITFTQVTL